MVCSAHALSGRGISFETPGGGGGWVGGWGGFETFLKEVSGSGARLTRCVQHPFRSSRSFMGSFKIVRNLLRDPDLSLLVREFEPR